MSIVSTVNGGRTHIALGNRYGGNVNSYHHWLTKFVAKILGLSISVTVNGKQRELNKNSYKKFLGRMGYENVDVSDHKNFDKSIDWQHPLPDFGEIRDAISKKKQGRLLKKLAQAILKNDEAGALRAIYQGADLEHHYHQLGDDRLHFGLFERDLDKYTNHKFQVTTGTPWIHACHLKREAVKKALKEAGASVKEIGETFLYKRNITSIRRRWDLGFSFSIGIGFLGLIFGPVLCLKKKSEIIHMRKRKNIERLDFFE